MTRLLDINVLLAFAWPQHVHHLKVKRWFLAQTAQGRMSIATCPLTQLGFLRVSMNIKGYAADFESAQRLLSALVNQVNFKHSFWADDFSLLNGALHSDLGPSQLTDAYLVALVESRGNSRLSTLDAGIRGSRVELI